jgi:hypothetical protein
MGTALGAPTTVVPSRRAKLDIARLQTPEAARLLRMKHPFTITYSVLSQPGIPYGYANRP